MSKIGYIEEENPHYDLARKYLGALLKGERHLAVEMVMNAVESGVSVEEVYLQVFQPILYEVGRLWQTNQVSVAQEHYCTAATQLIMSQLYPRIFSTEKNGLKLIATCVGGELHEVGVRMVADFFEMKGWDTYYLGANAPVGSIIESIESSAPNILAISAAMTFNIAAVSSLISEVRKAIQKVPKILVGGRPFNMATELWKQVEADGYAPDARTAIQTGHELAGS